MRHHAFRLLCALIAVAFLLSVAPAARAQGDEKPKTKEKGAPKSVFQGYYAAIVTELKMTADQKAKMEEILKARAAALKTWDDANGSKVAELTAAEAKAKEAKDIEAGRKATAEVRALRRGRTAIEADYRKQWQALLTPDQTVHLRGYGVYNGTLARLGAVETTDEQKTKIKALALDANKAATQTTGPEWTKLRDDLTAKVEKEVLTDEQRATLAKAAAEKAKEKNKTKTTPEPGAPK